MKTKKNILRMTVFPVILLIFTLMFIAADKPNEGFKYIGVDKCAATCHRGDAKGKQYEIWQDSKHAQAFKVLQTPEADKIAQEKGFSTPAAETPQCVKCHVLGQDIVEADLEATFDKTQGVQCETCHGAGSEYKKLTVMKDKNLALQSGLKIHKDDAEFCKGCHNPESPTHKEFVYEEFWAKIKHPKP